MMTESKPAKQPLVSIVVPMYQVGPYLRACLDSIAAQTYTNIEVLMVDDGSTDGTVEIAEEYAEKDSRFQLFCVAPCGVSGARNAGLDRAKGEWIGFCDSDDIMLQDGIRTLLTAALENNTAMSMGAYVEAHPRKRFSFNRPVGAHAGVYRTPEETQRYFLTYGKYLCHMWTKLFRRDVFDGVRFPEGKIYEDNFILPELFEKAGSCAVVNKAVYHYIIRRGSLSTSKNIRKQMDGLEARQRYADFINAHHPELTGLANDMTLSFCCDLMGKIEHIGIENAQAEWDEVVTYARDLLPKAALGHVGFKIIAAMFRKDPRYVSRFVHWLFCVDGML